MLLYPTLFLLCVLANGRSVYEGNSANPNIIFGDILITEREKQISDWPENARMATFVRETWGDGRNFRWPDNIMPYTISSKFSNNEKKNIRDALKELEKKSCFKFPERTNEEDYVEYDDLGGGCYTAVGKSTGKQVISLADWCRKDRASIQHETMHKLGISHEHQRPDRDEYIDVIQENMESYGESQMKPDDLNMFEYTGLPYDVHSIMHYHGLAYGKFDQKTGITKITMKIKGTNKPIPVNKKLSELDIKRLVLLGSCPEPLPSNEESKETKSKQKSKKKTKKDTKKKSKKDTKKKKSNNKKTKHAKKPSKKIAIDSVDLN